MIGGNCPVIRYLGSKGARAKTGMFSIGFTDEPVEYPYDDVTIAAAPGLLVMGKTFEGFLANLALWDKQAYEAHWLHELKSIFDGASKATLIVSYDDPKLSYNMEIWPVYRDGDWIRLQNRLLFYESLPANFFVTEISSYLRDRETMNEEGQKLSEWSVGMRDLENFLHRCGLI